MMLQTLELVFTDALNKPLKLQIPKVEHKLTEVQVKENMKKIVALDILRISKSQPVKVHAAYLIDKKVTTIFETGNLKFN